MADFVRMIPFIFHFASGVYGKNGEDLRLPLEEQFLKAKKNGWSKDPDDPGGATMVDVTLGAYIAYCKTKGMNSPDENSLRNITFVEWREILKIMYWDVWHADSIESQGMANLLVDWLWGSGVASIRIAQRIIGVKADGIVGVKTLGAVNDGNQKELFMKIRNEREAYYRRCKGAWKYLAGWLRRLDAILPDGRFRIYDKLI